jgi:hypothetical protein
MQQTITALILLLASTGAQAQWQVVSNDKPPPAHLAQAINQDGARLQIFRDAADKVHLRFRLHPGFDQLTGCPTFQVSGKPPVHQSSDGSPCAFGDNWADFSLGQIHNSQLNSLTLHRIMNGEEITLRYTLKNHRYGEARFSLDGSKQAVIEVIGQRVGISADKNR